MGKDRPEAEATDEKGGAVDALLDPERKAGADWFTKLVRVERAKAFRREAQTARKGKPITFSGTGRRLRSD